MWGGCGCEVGMAVGRTSMGIWGTLISDMFRYSYVVKLSESKLTRDESTRKDVGREDGGVRVPDTPDATLPRTMTTPFPPTATTTIATTSRLSGSSSERRTLPPDAPTHPLLSRRGVRERATAAPAMTWSSQQMDEMASSSLRRVGARSPAQRMVGDGWVEENAGEGGAWCC